MPGMVIDSGKLREGGGGNFEPYRVKVLNAQVQQGDPKAAERLRAKGVGEREAARAAARPQLVLQLQWTFHSRDQGKVFPMFVRYSDTKRSTWGHFITALEESGLRLTRDDFQELVGKEFNYVWYRPQEHPEENWLAATKDFPLLQLYQGGSAGAPSGSAQGSLSIDDLKGRIIDAAKGGRLKTEVEAELNQAADPVRVTQAFVDLAIHGFRGIFVQKDQGSGKLVLKA